MDSNQNEKSKSNIIFIVIILLLLVGIGTLYIKYNQSVETIKTIEGNLDIVKIEKDKLLSKLDSAEAEVQKYMGQSAKLDSILLIKQAEIDKMRTVIKTQNIGVAELAKYKKQIEVLRTTADQYIKENAYLKYQNDSLKVISKERQIKIDTMEVVNFQKTKQIEELSEKVEIGAQLRISDIIIITYNKKDKVNTRAKRVSKFQVSGTILKNALTEPGKKTIFVRITSPGGIVFTASPNNQFEFEGKTIMYTENKEITYSNIDSRFDIYYSTNTNDNLEIGMYNISIFCEGKEIGKSQIELR